MKGTVRFNLRLDKTSKNGTAPIELIYSVSNQRKYYNTGEKIIPSYWDSAIQRCFFIPMREAKKLLPAILPDNLPTDSEIDNINYSLSTIVKSIDDHEKEFIKANIPFSSEMIIDLIKGDKKQLVKQEAPKELVYDYIEQYIENNALTRAKGSLSVYSALSNHLKDFQIATGKKVRFDQIDHSFFQSFQNFLLNKTREEKDGTLKFLQNTTIAKQLSTLKTFLNYARVHNGVKIDKSLYDQFKIKRESLEVIALTQTEFDALYSYDLSNNKRLDQVRDVFCFACVTGLRYSDLNQLRQTHIKSDNIVITVTKTKERLTIPLSSYSIHILKKYSGKQRPLPVISAQNMNIYIKELCGLVGIDDSVEIVRYRGAKREATVYPKYELISVHTARKTFVTLSLERGMSAEEVMSVTGHSSYASFKRYVKITEDRKKVVMIKAWGDSKERQLKII